MARVSVILPAYKKSFLQEAIESILSQSYRDFELVVVDDASPENLKEVVDEFSDSRLSYHRNEKNLGGKSLVDAWTHAMQYATGTFCVLASDDDIYHQDYLKEMIMLSEKYPSVDIFHCRTGNINANGKISSYGDCHYEYETCLEFLYFRGVKRYTQIAPDFMFRIDAWKNIGGFVDFPVAYFSDDATWFSLALKNGIVCSKKMLFLARNSGINISNSTGNSVPKVEATLAFMDWSKTFLRKIIPSNEEEQQLKDFVANRLYHTNYFFILYLTQFAFWKEFIQIVKILNKKDKFIRNGVIKQRIKMNLDKLVHFFSFGKL